VLDKAGRAGVGVAWCSIGVDGSSVRTKVALIQSKVGYVRDRFYPHHRPAQRYFFFRAERHSCLTSLLLSDMSQTDDSFLGV
jgi:hypothetical protein